MSDIKLARFFFGGVECLNIVAVTRMMVADWICNNGIMSDLWKSSCMK